MEACTALTRLDASDNLLTAADGIAACEALRWLSIAKNAVTSLEPLRDLAGLEVLNAARNQLEGRVSVGRLRALKALVLNDNQITAVSGLDKLELDTLVLSNNRVASLGGWLAGAAALQKLSLSHNPLPELGAALRGCTALQELRLNHCALSTLPAELAHNPGLRILDAGGNRIADLAALRVLSALPVLRQLSLKGCPVAQLPGYKERVLQLAPRLRVLDNQRVDGASSMRDGGGDALPAPTLPPAALAAPEGAKEASKKRKAEAAAEQEAPVDGERARKKSGADRGEKGVKKGRPLVIVDVDDVDSDADDAVAFKAATEKHRLDPKRTGAVKVINIKAQKERQQGKKRSKGASGGAAAALQALLAGEAAEQLPGWD